MKINSARLRSLSFASIVLLLAPVVHAQALVGSWILGDATQPDSVAWVSFLSNGTYYLGQDGVADAGGHDGMERGTYTWNSNILATIVGPHDTNGDWGLSTFTQPAFVNGDILDLGSDVDRVQAARIISATNSLVGSWLSPDSFSVITFLDSGYYLEIEDGVGDSNGGPGIERGTYNLLTGQVVLNNVLDTSGDWGLGSGTFAISLAGDTLTFDGVSLTRIGASAVPEPSTYVAMIGGLALVGAGLYRRRRVLSCPPLLG